MILQILLAFQIIVDPGVPQPCSDYGPTHVSGIAIMDKLMPVRELEGVLKNVHSPSLSMEWTGTAYQRKLLAEFLRITESRKYERRLRIFLPPVQSLENSIDDLVNTLFQSGQFSQNLDYFEPNEISLCLRRDDKLSDYQFSKLVNRARNAWPWFICRDPKPDKTIHFTAGADNLNVTDWSLLPSTLGSKQYRSLEYAVSNVGTSVSTSSFLSRMRRHYLYGGTINMSVWYQGGKASRYKGIVERMDRWSLADVPVECR